MKPPSLLALPNFNRASTKATATQATPECADGSPVREQEKAKTYKPDLEILSEVGKHTYPPEVQGVYAVPEAPTVTEAPVPSPRPPPADTFVPFVPQYAESDPPGPKALVEELPAIWIPTPLSVVVFPQFLVTVKE